MAQFNSVTIGNSLKMDGYTEITGDVYINGENLNDKLQHLESVINFLIIKEIIDINELNDYLDSICVAKRLNNNKI